MSLYTDHTTSTISPSPSSLKALPDSSIVETVESLYKSPVPSVVLTSEAVTNQAESFSSTRSSIPEVFQNHSISATLQVTTTTTAEIIRTTTAEIIRTTTAEIIRTTTAAIPSTKEQIIQTSTDQVYIAETEERTKEKVRKTLVIS